MSDVGSKTSRVSSVCGTSTTPLHSEPMPIQLTEETFRGLLESAPDAMVIVDVSGTIILVNSQTEKVFGYSREELLGKSIEILVPDRFRGKHVSQRNSYFNSPSSRPIGAGLDLSARRKDGTEFPVEISLSPLRTPDGLLVTSAIRDISDRKKIERELKAAREMADTASKMKSEFLANMSHEIRTPLGGIRGYAEMLAQYGGNDDDRMNYATKIMRNVDNLAEIINDILDLSKVEAGALRVERIPISPLTELEGALSLVQSRAEAKGLTIETSVERPIPSSVLSDPTRLRQILVNMVGNAVKFTEKGKISIRVRRQEKYLAFDVEDTGCGIPEAMQPLLFNPFSQVDTSTTRKYGGTGLGLVLSQKLAWALGGDLMLTRSSPGKGSVFTVTIDSGTPGRPASPTPIPAAAQAASSLPIDLKDVRVLVAEDNADNEELVREFLTRRGASVQIARNGTEAVGLASSGKYDVILMDLQMPVLDGYEATRRLRAEGCRVPIVALTAHAMKEEREGCLQMGFTDFLTKPLDVRALLATVHRLGSSTKRRT